MKNKKMITEAESLTQYLNDWKEATSDLYTEDDIMISFLNIKERQFNLKSSKKKLNARLSDKFTKAAEGTGVPVTASDKFFV